MMGTIPKSSSQLGAIGEKVVVSYSRALCFVDRGAAIERFVYACAPHID
jgi:hypothetical protein